MENEDFLRRIFVASSVIWILENFMEALSIFTNSQYHIENTLKSHRQEIDEDIYRLESLLDNIALLSAYTRQYSMLL